MKKKIRLANKSRSNRMFFDNLVKEIAICINVGDTSINRELELPSYRGIQRRGEEAISHGSKVSAIGFDTPVGILSRKALDAIDLMLQEAKSLIRGVIFSPLW